MSQLHNQLFAHVHCPRHRAVFALDVAAPFECALATFHDLFNGDGVASSAAHEVTPVHTHGGHVAGATHRPRDAVPLVTHAEIGRVFEKDQVLLAGRFVVGIVGFELELVARPSPSPNVPQTPGVAHQHPRGSVESVLEGKNFRF